MLKDIITTISTEKFRIVNKTYQQLIKYVDTRNKDYTIEILMHIATDESIKQTFYPVLKKKYNCPENIYNEIFDDYFLFLKDEKKLYILIKNLFTAYMNKNILFKSFVDFHNDFNFKLPDKIHSCTIKTLPEEYENELDFLIDRITYYLCNQLVY